MMALEAWTPRKVKETAEYIRVSMNEQVTFYINKRPMRDGITYTEVYFYGPNHQRHAEVYAAITGVNETYPTRATATSVFVPMD